MNETVTSVSKKEQNQFDAAAAITVLSSDDIRRSGATTIADALRLVPGMNVAAVNAREMAVSARGFNNVFSNKLLVLVDGRAVYNPVFSGVFWDLQQVPLEQVDRIEVIRGPGATIWGANAVNGVVNVVTRDARDSLGGLIYANGGNVQEYRAGGQYGGQAGEHTYYRAFASARSTDDYPLASGQPAHDGWRSGSGGFRIDFHPDDATHLTWQADGTSNDVPYSGADFSNANTVLRWSRNFASHSSTEVQAYYDRNELDDPARAHGIAETLDLTAQHTFQLGQSHDLIWGLGYRYITTDLTQTSPAVFVRNEQNSQDLFSAFVQDEFKAIPDLLTVTAGLKFEHNDYTGSELQPSLRAAFKPSGRQTLWTAVSRAVRTPAQIEGKDILAIVAGGPFVGPGPGIYLPMVVGDADPASEVLWAYELGYRIQPTSTVGVDIAAFYNDYSDVIGIAATPRFQPGLPVGVAETPFVNLFSAETYGLEASVTTAVTPDLRFTGSYSWLSTHLHGPPNLDSVALRMFTQLQDGAPVHQFMLRASYDFLTRTSVDALVRYVDEVAVAPAYTTVDLQVSYRATDALEISVVGQNLLDSQHPEQGDVVFSLDSEVPRGVYAKATWRF